MRVTAIMKTQYKENKLLTGLVTEIIHGWKDGMDRRPQFGTEIIKQSSRTSVATR